MNEIDFNKTFGDYLKKLEEKYKERLEANKEKLKGKNGKSPSFLDKLDANLAIKDYENGLVELNKLNKCLSDIRFDISYTGFKFSTDLQDKLERIGSSLSETQKDSFKSIIRDSLRNFNLDKKKRADELFKAASSHMDKLKIKSKSIIKYDIYGKSSSSLEQLGSILEQYYSYTKSKINGDYLSLDFNKTDERGFNVGFIHTIKQAEELIKDKKFEITKENKDIIENIKQIGEAASKKEELEKIEALISNAIIDLREIKEVDFTKVIDFLNNVSKDNRKSIEKANDYLKKFNLTKFENEVKAAELKIQEENKHNNALINYQNLAYELEKAKTEDPNNFDKIHDIEAKMREVAFSTKMIGSELEDALREGSTKYRNEKLYEETTRQVRQETEQKEKQERRELASKLREAAIKELERSGDLDGDYEIINGDVRSTTTSSRREALIQKKINEMVGLSNMTPEERGLKDMIEHGNLPEGTKLSDLTPSQINDFRIGYSDSSYEYMSEVKREVNAIKAETTNVYKEYVKYLAALENKSEALKFSDYASKMYGIQNADLNMVDEEVRGKAR